MVDYGIEGEVALVLGGTGGLGFACAQALTAAGAQLLINGRDAVEAARLSRLWVRTPPISPATFPRPPIARASSMRCSAEGASRSW